MTYFTHARASALLHLYKFAGSRSKQLHSDIAEHAISLALSQRRPDSFLARSAIRNARCTLLRRLRLDVARRAELSAIAPDLAFDALMRDDTVSAMAHPPSIERTMIMRDALNMLLEEVRGQIGEHGVEIARRFLDPIEEIAADLGCSSSRVKRVRALVRSIAERMTDEIRP